MKHHCYTDGTQIHESCSLADYGNLKSNIQLDCINLLSSGYRRTDFDSIRRNWNLCGVVNIVISISLTLRGSILPDGDVEPSEAVHDLDAFFDQAITLKEHVNHLVKTCNFQLRRIRSIRR